MNLLSLIGGLAAALTSISYLPQVKKAWPRGSTDDLSLMMLIVLTTGLWLWSIYGIMKGDWVIISANVIGGSLSLIVLVCKLRDIRFSYQNKRAKPDVRSGRADVGGSNGTQFTAHYDARS
jgi:MtN3 and saliva related transmembrane protein